MKHILVKCVDLKDVRNKHFVTSSIKDLLWAPAQRKRATMLYFANVFFIYFFMGALFSGPGERRFAKVLHVVDLERR